MSRRSPAPESRPFDRSDRDARVESLADDAYDLVVLGAGVTGSAVARDAALRGLSVLLLDQGDLGGSSSPPRSVLPPGRRSELRRLHQLGPHLVHPHPLLLEPGEGGPRALRWSLTRQRALGRYEGLRRGGAPAAGIPHGVAAWGRVASEGRLALALARGAHDAGADVLSWLGADDLRLQRARVRGVTAFDRLTGRTHEIDASVVVDATGPWTDRTRGSRGVRGRLVDPQRRAALCLDGGLLPEGQGLRLANGITALPWAGRTLVSGADVDHSGDFDAAAPSAEQSYRLRSEIARALDIPLPARVHGSWAGLVARGAEGVTIPGVFVGDDGLITVVGGGSETHRTLAAEALTAVARALRDDGVHVGGCLSDAVPLPGAGGVAWSPGGLDALGPGSADAVHEADERLGAGTAAYLLATYGGRWLDVAALAAESPDLGRPLVPGLPLLAAQVPWAIAQERVCSLPDLVRRLEVHTLALHAAEDLLPALADALVQAQGWSSADRERQARFTAAWLSGLHLEPVA